VTVPPLLLQLAREGEAVALAQQPLITEGRVGWISIHLERDGIIYKILNFKEEESYLKLLFISLNFYFIHHDELTSYSFINIFVLLFIKYPISLLFNLFIFY
jgi:hypothetical protein